MIYVDFVLMREMVFGPHGHAFQAVPSMMAAKNPDARHPGLMFLRTLPAGGHRVPPRAPVAWLLGTDRWRIRCEKVSRSSGRIVRIGDRGRVWSASGSKWSDVRLRPSMKLSQMVRQRSGIAAVDAVPILVQCLRRHARRATVAVRAPTTQMAAQQSNQSTAAAAASAAAVSA